MNTIIRVRDANGNLIPFSFARGPRGEQGDIGPIGPMGPKGEKGDTGAQGPIGETGPQGPRGEKGAKGDIGPQGPVGTISGLSVNVVSLETGADPTVDQTVNGSETILTFGIPKGDKGDKGDKGEQGLQGEMGPQGLKGEDAAYSIKTVLDELAEVDSLYILGEQETVNLVLPETAKVGKALVVIFRSGVSPTTLTVTGTQSTFNYSPSANAIVELNALQDGIDQVIMHAEVGF